MARIVNDSASLALRPEKAGEHPEVVLEATYGWYWAADTLQAARGHGAPRASIGCQGVPLQENDVRDARDLADRCS